MIILITGGARSGKSAFCEKMVAKHNRSVLYIATSVVEDDDMASRVAKHRAKRPSHWRTIEEFHQLGDVIRSQRQGDEAVMLECITTMIAHLLYELSQGEDPNLIDFAPLARRIDEQIEDLIAAALACPAPIYLVTNELGMSVTPENRLARHFVDIAGQVNQRLAEKAHSVWLVVSGIGVNIK